MKGLELASRFRRRMIPLVLIASSIVAVTAPAAYFVQKRGEALADARLNAHRVAGVVGAVMREQPHLWRYNAPRLTDRLLAEGLDTLPALEVRDARDARVVALEPPGGMSLLWAREDIDSPGALQASVWAGTPTAPLWAGTARLGMLFSALALALGLALHHVPMRALRSAEVRIRQLMARLGLTLQEEERRRIARDLHDGVAQAITAARLHLLSLPRTEETRAARESIASHLDEALDELRRSTAALLPAALVELGLRGALERHCEAVAGASGLRIHCELDPLPALKPHLELACYRIVQETLHNTVRHSGAHTAWVRLREAGGALHLEVEDDGSGFPEGPTRGSGLVSIQERVGLLGGSVELPSPGASRFRITLPREEEEAE